MARRKTSKKKLTAPRIIVILVIVIGYALWAQCNDNNRTAGTETVESSEPATQAITGNLLKVKMPGDIASVEKQYRGMDISFNPKKHIPNWVAWELTDEETYGKVPRADSFASDPTVAGCPEPADYTNSGYDRGHMAPAGDMKWDSQAMEQTFYLTNILPQDHALNTGTWRTIEEKSRKWAQAFGEIYIVCGPVPSARAKEYIGDTRVFVPRELFKVIIAPSARMGIGFLMPNARVEGGMQKCVVSIDSVESVTGYDFFSALPDDIERDIESQHNLNKWNTARKRK